MPAPLLTLAGISLLAALSGQAPPGGLPQAGEPVTLDPAQFSTHIDNPYWPMRPGTRWTSRETAPDGSLQKVVVRVTHRTRLIANGIRARVVRDTVTEHGRLVEDTRDWYAQDAAGTVWYLGERTTEYEDGKPVSTEGSFEAGVDGAQPGVVMPGAGCAGHAEDRAAIISLDEQVTVPAGHYRHVLLTRETNPLEPRALEYKLFARGVGPVLALEISGGDGREELLRMRRGH